MKVFLGADHRGYELKERIKDWLSKNEIAAQDLGAHNIDPNDDYPTYAALVAEKVNSELESKGIVICGSGVGVDIVANKFDGVRAGLGLNPSQVRSARKDDDINVLSLASDNVSFDNAIEMVQAFLDTSYEISEKHERRLDEIEKIENEQ